MKICPTCHQTYADASLNFCLTDGAVLNPVGGDQNPRGTIPMGQTPLTGGYQAFPTNFPENRGTAANNWPVSSRKKSRAWWWIGGVAGGLLLVGAISIIGIIALIASNLDNQAQNNTDPPSERKYATTLTDDFSKTNWLKASNNNGDSAFRNGEFFVNSKQIGYLYVLVTGDKNFKTWNATTTVNTRNVNGTPTNLGYGLVIHSNSLVALEKDYAFLIDSTKQSYRVVQHQNKDEKTLVNWTKFPAIRGGTETNEIQVRDENGKMSMFINGQFATSITDSVNFKEGVTGVYAADAVPIAFSNLQLGR